MQIWQSENLDPVDNVTRLQRQLDALLGTISGEGADTFNTLNSGSKADLLWLASDLSRELGKAIHCYISETP